MLMYLMDDRELLNLSLQALLFRGFLRLVSFHCFIREQDNCPSDNCPPDNCPPKIATPEIDPQIISPWTIGAQIIAPQNN